MTLLTLPAMIALLKRRDRARNALTPARGRRLAIHGRAPPCPSARHLSTARAPGRIWRRRAFALHKSGPLTSFSFCSSIRLERGASPLARFACYSAKAVMASVKPPSPPAAAERGRETVRRPRHRACAARASTISRTSTSTIPRDKLVVFTGLSGSGKSSLAFDTIYAEGQRRYVEVAFGLRAPVPGDDAEAGRRPDRRACRRPSPSSRRPPRRTRARPSARSPRSTTTCACCGRASACPIRPPPACRSRARRSARWSTACWRCPSARGSICSRRSCAAARASTARRSPNYMKRGFQRLKIDGEFYEIADAPALDKKLKHDIEVVVDRLVVRPDMASRLAESFETALELADGMAIVEFADAAERRGRRAASASSSRRNSPARSPASPSPRSSRGCSRSTIPFGACPACGGLGSELEGRSRRWSSPIRALTPAQGRDRAVGEVALALLPADAGGARRVTTSSASTSRGRAAREGARRHPLRLGRRGGALRL